LLTFLVKMLEEDIDGAGPEEPLFPRQSGGTLRHNNWMKRHFRPAVDRLVDRGDWPEERRTFRFHDLRHTHVALLIRNGEHPKTIQNQLKHSSITMTLNRYKHL